MLFRISWNSINLFLDDSYLKYIGWTLHDKIGDVRYSFILGRSKFTYETKKKNMPDGSLWNRFRKSNNPTPNSSFYWVNTGTNLISNPKRVGCISLLVNMSSPSWYLFPCICTLFDTIPVSTSRLKCPQPLVWSAFNNHNNL